MRKIKSFSLLVNNEVIPAKTFVREFVGNSLLAQIECLRLKDPEVKTINLQIEYDSIDA